MKAVINTKQLAKRTLKETIAKCEETPYYKVGVFCTTETITDEAFRRAIELLDEYTIGKKLRDILRFNMTEKVIMFPNGSTIQYIDRVENMPGLKLDEILYHSLLTLDRYGDTLQLLQLMEYVWNGGR